MDDEELTLTMPWGARDRILCVADLVFKYK